ncbi:hypothetical protein [Novosphingobium sp. CECT 9465]|uniref:hypothetical protein n=1 Tax=Novosphingobium sp. CECT 9465 TaxID=2829794 RepID=UPI001E4467C8|nr:hypothetical protein [Novosphingobium sp. CECT 9465]CAH0496375.1 hypothetical protein NVSP9465_01407 [Novosphingobium sp. CECT 9465]
MAETRRHPETGKLLTRGERPQLVTLDPVSRTVLVPGWYHDDDSDSIHSGEDLKISDAVFQQLKAK